MGSPIRLKSLARGLGMDRAPPSQLHFTVKRHQTGQSPALEPGFLKLARGGVSSMNWGVGAAKAKENWDQEPSTIPTPHPPKEDEKELNIGSAQFTYPFLGDFPRGGR